MALCHRAARASCPACPRSWSIWPFTSAARHATPWPYPPGRMSMPRHLLLVSTALLLTACATAQPDALVALPTTLAEAPATAAAPAPATKNADLAAFFENYDKA